jgi:pseudouridine synthase
MINKLEGGVQESDLVNYMMSIVATLCFLMCLSLLQKDTDGLHTLSSLASNRPHPQNNGLTLPNDAERTIVILFNKPENVLTSHISEDSRSTVYDEVQSMKGFVSADPESKLTSKSSFQQATGISSKINSVGRLDADTSGLLLLTNDGGLIHHVTNPNAPTHTNGAITKTYEALIMGHHDEDSLNPLWEGVDIGAKYGGMTRPVNDLHILDHPNHKSTNVSLTISEGKNRQVRRMFHALGSGVMKLKRTKIGDRLTLEGLDVGQWRVLSDDEVCRHLQWETRKLEAFPRKPKHKTQTRASRSHATDGGSKSKHFGQKRRRRN